MGQKIKGKNSVLIFLFLALFSVVMFIVAPFNFYAYDASVMYKAFINTFNGGGIFTVSAIGNDFATFIVDMIPALTKVGNIISVAITVCIYVFACLAVFDLIVGIVFVCKKNKSSVKAFAIIDFIFSIILFVVFFFIIISLAIVGDKYGYDFSWLLTVGFVPLASMLVLLFLKGADDVALFRV